MYFSTHFPIDNQFLTAREAEVLWLCADGLTIPQMADRLFVSPRTINRHCENIRLRFGLTGYHSLRQFALKIRPELEKWVK